MLTPAVNKITRCKSLTDIDWVYFQAGIILLTEIRKKNYINDHKREREREIPCKINPEFTKKKKKKEKRF